MDCSVVIKGKGEARNYHRSRFDSWKKAVPLIPPLFCCVIAGVDLRVSSSSVENVGRRLLPRSSLLSISRKTRGGPVERRFDTAESAKIKCLTALIVPRRLWGNIILRVCPTNDNDTIGRREVCCRLSYPVSIEISSSSSFFLFL